MEVAKKSILVTGASRGLGAALARELARAGARVVLVARGESALEEVVRGIRSEGGAAWSIAADVADKNAIAGIVGAASALAGPIDVLVNNASTLGPVPLRPLLETDCEDLESALNVNVVGPFRLIKAVVGGMILRGEGLLLNVSSDAAVEAYPEWGAYGASKAAFDHLARILGAELDASRVRVVSVDPGEMNTQMHRDAVPGADPATLLDPAVVARRLVSLMKHSTSVANGARVCAQDFDAEARS